MVSFENDIRNCLTTLEQGGIILYPTDTIWGIGCDATNDTVIEKIFSLKNRADSKAMIILIAEEKDIYNYAEGYDKRISGYLSAAEKPTTVIYEKAKNISGKLISTDGTVGIRIPNDDFCRELISRFGRPIVSTSANISGELPPKNYNDISPEIKNGVDYIVQHRQDDIMSSQPSSIIKLNKEGDIEIIRP